MAGRGGEQLNYGLIKVLAVIVHDEKGSRRSQPDAKMAMHLIIDVFIPRTDKCCKILTGGGRRAGGTTGWITGQVEGGEHRMKYKVCP